MNYRINYGLLMSLGIHVSIISGLLLSSCAVENRRPELAPRPERKRPGAPSPKPNIRPPEGGQTPPKSIPLTAEQEQYQKAEVLNRKGEVLEALRLYVASTQSDPRGTLQNQARSKAIDIVETKLDQNQLEKVSDDSDFGFARGHAYFRLGKNFLANRDFAKARDAFSRVANLLPGTDLGIQASDYIAQLESLNKVEAKTIGAVLPLSGKNASLGQKALRGIQLGLGLHQSASNFKLAVVDSEGNPDTARRGVERLIREDNVIGIVGSLLSKTATAVAAKANELGVPSIGLSQKSGLTEVGPSVFRNSLTSEMQVRQLVKVAMIQGVRRFAILYPNDPYGVEYANIFWDEVLARGGQVTAAQSYEPKDTDFRFPVQRLVGTFFIEARLDEYKAKSKEFLDSNKKSRASRENLNADDILSPIVNFDAIFIPDSAKTMGQLAAFLSYSGVKNVKLLGTNLWNAPGLGKRAGHFANQVFFVDALSLGSANSQSSRFYQEYKSLFNEEPGFIEFQAYDSALLLRQLIVQGANSRAELTEKLAQVKQFPGALGDLNMNSNRELSRPLVTLTLDKSGEIIVLDAPYKIF